MANKSDTPEVREKRKRNFLEVYAQVGEIQPACNAATISRTTYQRWCKEDEEFAQACVDAKLASVDAAVVELRTRGVEGVEEVVLYKGEPVWKRDPDTGDIMLDDELRPVPFTRRVRSDRLLEVYVKAHRREYRDKGELALTGADGGPVNHSIEVTFVDSDGDGHRAKDPLDL